MNGVPVTPAPVGFLLITLGGAVAGGGLALLAHSLVPREVGPAAPPRSPTGALRTLGRRGPVAVAVALVALVVTRWPVAAPAGAALVLAGPALFGGAAAERRAAARIEALAVWTESLRDTIAGAAGLEQAIMVTAQTPPPAIEPHLRELAARLRVRTPLATALRGFADGLDDAGADLIVAALVLNSRLRGPGLHGVLSSLADSIREELEMRGRVSAGRRSTRRSVQIVVGVTVVFVLGLARFNPGYVAPYGSVTGQLVLVIVVGLFALGFVWLRRLSSFDVPERFLATAAGAGAGAGGGAQR